MRSSFLFSAYLVLLVILGGCSRGDGVDADTTVAVDEPNRFARFFNPIAGLQAGDYTIVAATTNADTGALGSFTLTVTFDDGEIQEFTGNWTSPGSGGQDETSTDNLSFDITLYSAGGISIQLESADADTYVYLLFAANGAIVDEDNDSASGTNSLIKKEASRIDFVAYAKAYYAAIDPDDTRTTLEDWKVANGYPGDDSPDLINARFRDTKDLGYGRGMRVWTTADGSTYAFVENFQVAAVPGQEYSSLNLEALIKDDRQYHFGTNAIEFSTYPYGTGEPSDLGGGVATKFAKFFSFDASGADKTPGTLDHANEIRLNTVNLDGRGEKSIPGACVYCHGGTVKPLLADGSFRDNSKDGATGNDQKGDVNAKLQLIEVNSLEFWDEYGSSYTRAWQETPLKQINQAIYCTYPNTVDVVTPGICDVQPPDPAILPGTWSATFAREMAEGWYDADPTTDAGVDGFPDFDSATFMDDFVPTGWRPNAGTGNPPAGTDQLFLKAVGSNCFLCHSRRGVDFAGDNENEHIDFSTYDKFINDAELIKDYVYDKGVMPNSLRGYLDFWTDSDAPVVMASFLNGVLAVDNQISLNSSGDVDQPGAPLVDAGPDRTTSSPTRLFGANSRFVDTYSWSIVSTPVGGEAATLTEETTSSALLTAAVDGDYVIQLTASNGTLSDTDTVTIKVSSVLGVADPKNLDFNTHVVPIFAVCTGCHANAATAGVPVWWTAGQPMGGTTLYEEVLTRVDFNDPTKSLILTKPSGNHHAGSLLPFAGFDIDNPSDRADYDTILNWILEGAREN